MTWAGCLARRARRCVEAFILKPFEPPNGSSTWPWCLAASDGRASERRQLLCRSEGTWGGRDHMRSRFEGASLCFGSIGRRGTGVKTILRSVR